MQYYTKTLLITLGSIACFIACVFLLAALIHPLVERIGTKGLKSIVTEIWEGNQKEIKDAR